MTAIFDPAGLASPACPLPVSSDRITLSHGAGAGATARLFEEILWPHFRNDALGARHDGAVLDACGGRIAFTTDTFVVNPVEFPGGDIGSLAVHGTINDLAMCGARPLALSCALVLEEGLPLDMLSRIAASMGRASRDAGVCVVTGDTKVVERGKGDGLFINTSGIGIVPAGRDLRPGRVGPGDVLIVSGPLGCHGAAVLSVREGLAFESDIVSDSAPLAGLTEALLEAAPGARCLRDPTRGGLGAAAHEIAAAAGVEIEIEEQSVPVTDPVRAACELLGIDPLFLASEGRLAVFVPEEEAAAAIAALRGHPLGTGAVRVGRALPGEARVVIRTRVGARRLLPLPAGEPLPRIC